MKVLVFGAGVLGSLYAARLKRAGHTVTVLARGQRLQDIREHGIVLEDIMTGETLTTRVKVIEQLAPDDEYELVLVPVRRNQVASVLPALAVSRGTPNVLFMTNNASGPGEMIAALGRERVLLGFAGAGGKLEGHKVLVYVAPGSRQPTTIGELDGRTTPRIERIAEALRQAGFPVEICPRMDAWLRSHVAVISPLANAYYMAGSDVHRLAHTRDALVLAMRAVREGFRVLRALDIPVTKSSLRLLEWAPEPLLVGYYGRVIDSPRAEIAIAGHANAARDEMRVLSEEFQALARASGMPTPCIDALHSHTDPSMPPMPAGEAEIPENWWEVWRGIGVVGVLAAVGGFAVVGARALRGAKA